MIGGGHQLGPAELAQPDHQVEPRIATRRVALRIVTPADHPFLYTIATQPMASYRWRYRGGTPSPEQFGVELWKGVLCQHVLVRVANGEPVGLLSAYQADLANRTCYFGVLGDVTEDASGLMLEGTLLFLTYLFHTWDLRQIYAEVPGYVLPAFASGMDRYFREEGRLIDHSYHAGRYWDLHLLAIHRASWAKTAEPLLDALGAQGIG